MTVIERALPDEKATALLGEDIAAALRPGDVIALKGDLGAGKTMLARALVRALAGDPSLDVPSPTFTLVQAYDARLPVAHFDLYRIGSPAELDELGFTEAAADGVVLVEWPERAGDRLPVDAITVELTEIGDSRLARISANAATARIEHSFAVRDFLDAAGWPAAHRTHLAGDASARAYETVSREGSASVILMNSPLLVLGPPVRAGKAYAEIAHTARSVSAFLAIDRLLHRQGYAVPEIFAHDLKRGFVLIENLGAASFLGRDGEPIAERYEAAAALLADLHRRPWPREAEIVPGTMHVIPPFDRAAIMIEAELLLDWYLPVVAGRQPTDEERAGFAAAWGAALDRLADAEQSLMLRDYHSPNIIWRGEKSGHDRLALIDFQDALIGPSAYDVASLAMDARVTISPEIEKRTVEAYVRARQRAGRFDRDAFEAAYAVMAAQRNSKILGIFVRLDRRDGKPAYLKHLSRIRDYLRRALAHPALIEMRQFYDRHGLIEERAL